MPSRLDPRWFQIASLATLLMASIVWFDLGANTLQSVVTIASVLGMQWLLSRATGIRFDPLSPLITGFSLSLLLRSHDPAVWIAASVLGIGSKFVLRISGKHVFNPANFAIVALLAMGAQVWVSPGQWGAAGWLVAALITAGGLVLSRSRRLSTAAAFLGTYGGLLGIRAFMLGDPLTIPLHQLQSGSLLLFTCFMITDPRSTPNHLAGRLVFAAAVAVVAYHLQFDLQIRTGVFWALACVSLATPVIDFVLRADRFRWRQLEA